jgi:hypothetical protein
LAKLRTILALHHKPVNILRFIANQFRISYFQTIIMPPMTDSVVPHGNNGVYRIANGKDTAISTISTTSTRNADSGLNSNSGKHLPAMYKVAYLGPQGTYSHQVRNIA